MIPVYSQCVIFHSLIFHSAARFLSHRNLPNHQWLVMISGNQQKLMNCENYTHST